MTDLPSFQPMLATTGTPSDPTRWVAEPKWDGYRLLIATGPAGVTVRTRRGRVVTTCLPELAPLSEQLGGRRAVFDGELLAYRHDELDFYALSRRLAAHTDRAVDAARRDAPTVAMLFDILWLDDTPLIHQPWRSRRAALEQLHLHDAAWQTTPVYPYDEAVLDVCERHNLEGIVAKHLDSPYRPGTRSRRWLKHKFAAWQRDHAARRIPSSFRTPPHAPTSCSRSEPAT